jgi:hypothetical protein
VTPSGVHVAVSAGATALGLALALAGTSLAAPEGAWPRFWASAFFVLLLWPVGLTLTGRLAGVRAQVLVAGVLLLASAVQQAGRGTVPLPEAVRWSATLSAPDDAVRHRVPLPPPGSTAWERTWRRAARAVVAVCTESAITPLSGVTLALGQTPPYLLPTVERLAGRDFSGWYALQVTEEEVSRAAEGGALEVTVRRGAGPGGPLHVCGGRDDPTRPGAGGSARWRGGRWSGEQLADEPFPLVAGRPILGRYFIELRFLDGAGRPAVDIWY